MIFAVILKIVLWRKQTFRHCEGFYIIFTSVKKPERNEMSGSNFVNHCVKNSVFEEKKSAPLCGLFKKS
jgi:hypothetical protein